MKKENRTIGMRRFSMSPKSHFPPLSSHSYARSELGPHVQPITVYSALSDKNQTNGHKFFTLKPHYATASPNTDISTCRSVITSQDRYASPNHLHSDIIERIESYEIRSKKGNSIENLLSNYKMLQKCFEDIVPNLSDHNCEIKESLVKFTKHFSSLAKEALASSKNIAKENNEKLEKLSKDFSKIEAENKKLSKELQTIKEYKKLEMEKIEKEIEEIFGKNDLEIAAMRLISNEHQDKFNQNTVEYLMQVWRSMDQEFEIPDIKNGDFLGMDPSEVPELLSRKLSFLQRFTAKKVSEIFRTKKKVTNNDTQTYTEYIHPSSYEEQSKNIEKLQIQLSTAVMSIEKYRENFGSKINVLENLEGEKANLVSEVGKLRKEVEGLSHTLEKSHFELKKVTSELDSAKREKEILVKEKATLHSEVVEREKVIKDYKESVEKFEKTTKDKEEKIQVLEKSLAKRVKKTKENPGEDSSLPQASQKRATKFDEKEFMASIKSGKRASKDSPSISTSINPQHSSNPTSQSNPPGNETRSVSPDSPKLSNHSTSSGVASKSKKALPERAQSPQKRGLNIKLNQIDEVPSPTSKPQKRADERFPDINFSVPKKKSRDRSRGTATVENDTEEVVEPKNRRTKDKSSRMESGSEDLEDNPSFEESSQEYNSGNSVYIKRPKNSRHSQISDISKGSRGSKRSGSEFYNAKTASNSKATSMEDLIWESSIKYSKAVQMNGIGIPDEAQGINDGVYMFPYNPNQFYALRGDKYYHTTGSVFAAQPRIPDLKNSVTFCSPYQLSPKEDIQ